MDFTQEGVLRRALRSASVLCSVFVYPAWALALAVRFIQHNAQHMPTSYLDMLVHRMVHCALVRSSIHDAESRPTSAP